MLLGGVILGLFGGVVWGVLRPGDALPLPDRVAFGVAAGLGASALLLFLGRHRWGPAPERDSAA